VSNYDTIIIKIATACAHLFLFNHYTCIQSHLCVRDVQLSAYLYFVHIIGNSWDVLVPIFGQSSLIYLPLGPSA